MTYTIRDALHADLPAIRDIYNDAVLNTTAIWNEVLGDVDNRKDWLAARRNTIVAPVSGYVAKRSVQIGARATPGTSLMAIVPLDQLWVDANFKESELKNIRVGQPAKVEADMYGSKVEFHGRVVGLSAGTGSAFSLLPAQNASGNWIKIVQRVPVRIAIDAKELAEHPLRIGLSMKAEVSLRDQKGEVLPSTPAKGVMGEPTTVLVAVSMTETVSAFALVT